MLVLLILSGGFFPVLGLPRWLSGKELPANAGHTRGTGSIPGSERSPGGGNDNPFQYSCLGNPMDRGVVKSQIRLSD